MEEDDKKALREEIIAEYPDMPKEVSAYLDRVNEPSQYESLKAVMQEQTGEAIQYKYNDRGVTVENGSLYWTHSDNAYAFGDREQGASYVFQHNPNTHGVRQVATNGEGAMLDVSADKEAINLSYSEDGLNLNMSARASGKTVSGKASMTITNEDGEEEYSAKGTFKSSENTFSLKGSSVDRQGDEPVKETLEVDINGKEGKAVVKENGVNKVDPAALAMYRAQQGR